MNARLEELRAELRAERIDAARKIVAEWDEASIPNARGNHNRGGFARDNSARILEALRALIDPPATDPGDVELLEAVGVPEFAEAGA